MKGFIEVHKREYYRGGYVLNDACFSVDDISRVVECTDDYNYVNIITKDGKVHTIGEKYAEVIQKISKAIKE